MGKVDETEIINKQGMVLSMITINRNNAAGLEKTMQSVDPDRL